jgi:Asp-tRNA(Asn)/Glu-tRNA(Gln) amidotransferase A subunit family amidase
MISDEHMTEQLLLPLRTRMAMLELGELSADRWRAALINHVRRLDPEVRAFESMHLKDLHDERIPRHPVVTYKDTIDVHGHATRLGMRSGYRYYPQRSAHIVERLADLGYVCAGKVATTELGIGTRIPCRNPRYPTVSAGGSSSGSGVAVAAGFCDLSIGTDSSGSGRWPAVYCGVVGMRLTSGYQLGEGVMRLSPHMDSLALITRTADDLEYLWSNQGLRGELLGSEDDGTAIKANLRFGFSEECLNEDLHPAVRVAVNQLFRRLAEAGHVVDLTPVSWWDARESAWLLLFREAWDSHSGRLLDECDQGTVNALAYGRSVTDDHYEKLLAMQERSMRAASSQFAGDLDIVVMPLDPGLPDRAKRGHRHSVVPTEDPGFAISASIAGLPALSLPVACADDGSPIGVQLIARRGGEDLLISAGLVVEALSKPGGPEHMCPMGPDSYDEDSDEQ